MGKSRELRDPIHGFIQRSELEQKLIDTSVFQRLRGIKQLAMANLVYPGALHTRFDHSIGVMHVAGRMAQKLIDEENLQTVRLAALLHDIGHGPFSHVSEELLDKYYDNKRVKPRGREKIHELLTCQIIKSNKELSRVPFDREKIAGLISGTHDEPIIRGIISGPLDADKLDYLLRDSYFCGVKYGVYDLERLISTLEPYKEESGDTNLAASYDGIYAIEQYVLAKYHLAMQVYRHKIRLITDSMIVRALELGIEKDRIGWLIDLYKYDGTPEHLNNYLKWDDCRIIHSLLNSSKYNKTQAAEIFRRLRDRRLFKRIFSVRTKDIKHPRARAFLANINEEHDFKKRMENLIAAELAGTTSTIGEGLNPDYVIVSSFSIESVREQSKNNEGSIIIIKDDKPQKFENESALFGSIDEKQKEQFLEVYAPLSIEDDVEKRRMMKTLNKKIADAFIREALSERWQRRKQSKTKTDKKKEKTIVKGRSQ